MEKGGEDVEDSGGGVNLRRQLAGKLNNGAVLGGGKDK